ncbi:MAG: low specificity L-threonine aldolase [Bacteroidales bacterium]|nr:low specificity L-threonine aldolase [Bacteroidales bacterium]
MKNFRSFASDNNSGVHPEIFQAIIDANTGHTIAYGDDNYTKSAIKKFKFLLGDNIDVFFVFNGTGANITGLSTITNSYNSIICAETAHINVDECGAPEKITGCKIIPLHTNNGKITIDLIKPHVKGFGFEHHSQPKVISITQATELGTVYTPEEIKKITSFAHKNNMLVHVDGARICNAAASLGLSLKNITTDVDIDVLSFGGTKNGMMYGEAVIFFNKNMANNFKYIRKQSTQLTSKMRYISAQFEALLSNNIWLKNAKHANEMANLLADKIKDIPKIKITQKVETNGIFAIIPGKCISIIQEKYFFYVWDEDKSEVRWMTSYDTTEKDIDNFSSFLHEVIV